MRLLVTGGTGLLGSYVAERSLVSGDEVVLFDAAPALERVAHLREAFGDRLHIERGDVTSFRSVAAAIRAHRIDAVVHLAYVLGAESNEDPLQASLVNIMGTVNVFEAARVFEIPRVVAASSIAVYGSDDRYPAEQRPLREDAPQLIAAGLPIYGAGKVYLEQLARRYTDAFGTLIVGMRPSIVYGPGRRTGASSFAGNLVEKPALGEPARTHSGNARVSLVYVEDVAEQFLALTRVDPSCFERHRFFNTGGDSCTIAELAEVVRRVIPGAQIEVTCGDEQDVAGLAATVSDQTMVEVIGYRRRFTPLEVGVREHVKTVRARAGLPSLV